MDEVLAAGFKYRIECIRPDGTVKWVEDVKNLMPLEGRKYMIEAAVTGGLAYSSWYIGLFATNYAPLDGDTLASLLAAAPEFTSYSESQRVLFVPGAMTTASTLTNSDSKAEFTMTAATTIYGAFMTNQPVKSNTTGKLLSAAKFSTARDVDIGEVLRVDAGLVLVTA